MKWINKIISWLNKTTKKTRTIIVQIVNGLVLGVILGILLITMDLEHFGIDIFIYYLIFGTVSFLLQLVLHEGGHCVFGLLNGFSFLSFRIGTYMWVKEDGKIKFKRYHLHGTGGQCLMEPAKPNFNAYLWYNLGGGLSNIIFALLFMIAGLVFHDRLFDIFCFCMSGMGFFLASMNLIPIDAQVPNDGYNTYCMFKDKRCVTSIYQQLMLAKEFANGKSLKEIDEEFFQLYEGADLSNPLNTCIEANKGSRLLSMGQYDEAKACLENLHQLDLSLIYEESVIYDLVLIELLTSNQPNVDQYLNEKMKMKMGKNKTDISSLLDQYGIDLLVYGNEEQAMIDLKYFNDIYQSYPYEGIAKELKAYQKQLEERKMQNDEG